LKIGVKFTGVKILAYVIMPDHFHLLVAVPAHEKTLLEEGEFFRRVGPTLSRDALAELRVDWKGASSGKRAELQEPFLDRMGSLSEFMKNFVQRMTRFINREQGRKGALWQTRYRNAIIEEGFTAKAVSAYFHTNPVRAGLVTEPGDYEWSSFGKARKADRALAMQASLMALQNREPVPARAVKSLESAIAGLNPKFNEEDLLLAKAVSERIRHFIDGFIIGSADFVNRIFEANRDHFSEGRETGARRPIGPLKALNGKIQTVRALQRGI
jgi:REP element-mobilizing transposase RayT